MPVCSICGEDKSKEEMENDICLDCAFAKLKENDKDIGMNDFSQIVSELIFIENSLKNDGDRSYSL